MSSDSDDEILAGGGSGIGTRRQLRRRAGAAGAGTGAGRRLRDEDTEEDSGSEIEQARPKKGKKIPLPAEEDEAGPSGVQQVRWCPATFLYANTGVVFFGVVCYTFIFFCLFLKCVKENVGFCWVLRSFDIDHRNGCGSNVCAWLVF